MSRDPLTEAHRQAAEAGDAELRRILFRMIVAREVPPPGVVAMPEVTHLRTFQNGDRVVIPDGPSSRDLTCRTGVVEDAQPHRNGGLVRHDDGTLFGWAFHEMRDEKNPDVTNSTAWVPIGPCSVAPLQRKTP